jgi:hypothetical protein
MAKPLDVDQLVAALAGLLAPRAAGEGVREGPRSELHGAAPFSKGGE